MSDHQHKEEWRAVEGFPRYQVSNLGRVRSRRGDYKLCHGGYRPLWWRVLSSKGKRYPRAFLCRDKKVYTCYIHILVATAFIGPCPDGMEVNHKDGNKKNNHVENLEYISGLENKKHAVRLRLFAHGERHYKSMLTEQTIVTIRERHAEGERVCDLADEYRVSRACIHGIVKRTRWAHVPQVRAD